ncbi:hypothetical protein HDU79_000506 [Rhizoclosmatium sp. JEL0117]|nr:hypothetical protein HDU79_000506 [Rhizoclosmatium sp. JEL0117]
MHQLRAARQLISLAQLRPLSPRRALSQLATDAHVPSISRSKKPLPSQTQTQSKSDPNLLSTSLRFAVENENKQIASKAFSQLLQLNALKPKDAALEPDLLKKMIALFASNTIGDRPVHQLEETLRLLENILSLLPPSETSEPELKPYLELLNRLDKVDKFSSTWTHIVESAQDSGFTAPQLSLDIYNQALDIFGRHGLSQSANEVFGLLIKASTPVPLASGEFTQPMTAPPNDDSYFNLMSSHLSRAKPDLTGALVHFEQMTINASPPPTLPIFNLLIQAAGKLRDFATVKLLMDMLEPAGLLPNHITYNILIDAYAKAGDVENARKVLEEWNEAVQERNSNSTKKRLVPPTTVTFNTLMSMCAKQNGTPEEAQFLLKAMLQTVGVNKLTATAYMDVFKRRGDYAACREAFEMFETELGVPKFTEGYNVLLSCYGYTKNLDEMDRIYQEMLKTCRPTFITFRILVSACAAKLDVARLERWIKEMNNWDYDPDEMMLETVFRAIISDAKLSTGSKTVMEFVNKYLQNQEIKNVRLANVVLEAHIHDYLVLCSGPFDLSEVLQRSKFDTYLFATRKPNLYTLKALLDAVEIGLAREGGVIEKEETAKTLVKICEKGNVSVQQEQMTRVMNGLLAE